jgi:hypothetical protein
MSMGRRYNRQSPLWIAHDEISPGPRGTGSTKH